MASSDISETVVDLGTTVLSSNEAETEGDTQPASGGYVSQLKPPIGTMFFKEDHVTIFNNEEIFHWIEPLGRGGGHKTKVGSITWRASIYTYVAGARPDGDFEKHNGSILILIIHSGSVQMSGAFHPLEYTRRVTGPSSTTPKVQLPPSSSGNKRGSVWDYNISYHETLPMFKNSGNDTFNFEAKYGQDFSIEGAQQSSKELNDGWETCVKYEVDI
ncbi:hypothetical protein EYR40_009144 [Pleurotus pulmonarius]|nr:hypothetical protein EYR40_009144 [Pleurotus pulmonarius]